MRADVDKAVVGRANAEAELTLLRNQTRKWMASRVSAIQAQAAKDTAHVAAHLEEVSLIV